MVATVQDMDSGISKTLRLSITGECNLNCFYCKPLGRMKDLFQAKTPIQPSDVTKLVRIVGELGVEKIIIAGGEPLLRKDAANFVKSAYAHKNIQEVRLITNGTYLKAFADQLRKNGLRKVDVNFDTLSFKKFHALTKRDDLFRVLDGIEKVEKLKYSQIRVNIQLLTGINDEEIIDFARLTKERRLHLRFMEYSPTIANSDPFADVPKLSVLKAQQLISNFQKLFPVHDLESTNSTAAFSFTDALGKMSFLSSAQVEKERGEPKTVFNIEGVLVNELVPNRPLAVLAELRRDAKQDKLRKNIEKVLRLHTQPPRTISRKKPKEKITRGRRSFRSRVSVATH